MALFAPALAPYDPLAQGVGPANQGPSVGSLGGHGQLRARHAEPDHLRGPHRARVGIVSVVIALIIGVALGLAAGYYGGWADVVIMRVMDGLFAFPIIILAIAMMAVMGFGVKNVIIAVAVGFIAPFARVTRADVLAVKEEPYIEAARLGGVSSLAIIGRHVLPNVTAPIIVQAALRVSGAIITEAGLSFLGLGPPPPTPVWGSMIAEGRNFIVHGAAHLDDPGGGPHGDDRRTEPPRRRPARPLDPGSADEPRQGSTARPSPSSRCATWSSSSFPRTGRCAPSTRSASPWAAARSWGSSASRAPARR